MRDLSLQLHEKKLQFFLHIKKDSYPNKIFILRRISINDIYLLIGIFAHCLLIYFIGDISVQLAHCGTWIKPVNACNAFE